MTNKNNYLKTSFPPRWCHPNIIPLTLSLKNIAKLGIFRLSGFIIEEREGTGGEVEVGSY